MSAVRKFFGHVAHPMLWLRGVCGGESAYPLAVLFGLNAVDELDRTAFGILLPNIRDEFGLDNTKVLGLVALSSIAALALQVPIAQYADRSRRVPLAIVGALVWATFSGMTGLAGGVVVLTIARSGSSLGKAVIDPTHNSLLADYYPIEARSKVFSTHRAANAVGAFVGPLSAGMLAYAFGWRVPFLVFVVPTLIFAFLALRLREPVRGKWERAAMGASDEVANTEETVPSFAESWRTVQKIPTLQRLWWSLPFLATALIGFVVLASLLYEQQFGLDERGRGVAAAVAEPFQLVGLVVGTRYITKRFMADMRGLIRFIARVAIGTSVASVGFAFAPNVVIAVALNCVISGTLAVVGPGILVELSLAIPSRARATGFSVASLWVIPGLLILPLIGWISSHVGIRVGMLTLVPLFIIGSLILGTAQNTIDGDIAQVWQASAARSEALYQRRHGEADLLLIRNLDAGYGGRQVLFGVNFDVKEGEIVALLGTNGAGKSTLLKAISGVVEADRGAVILDGRDVTHAPPNEIAALGISQMPGGQGVFGGLTVQENLQLAGWTRHRDPVGRDAAMEEVLVLFPLLRERLHRPAADLSGGQQQMLALGMAFVAQPRVLLIDELSLGLAPVVVGQLLPIVQRVAQQGTAVILVEQSVNVALSVAERAYFMERGTIRFSGPTADLLGRKDLLRSVFLSGAAEPDGTATAVRRDSATDENVAPLLRVNEIAVAFGGNRAVNGATFDVRSHEIVGMIGPNGAGKTTIFDLVSGFVAVDSGRIELQGRDITNLGASERAAAGLGRSFQDARLFPDMTVSETLAVSLERWVNSRSALAAALRLPAVFDDEERTRLRVHELIELMNLGDYRNSFVRELSTGTRRVVDLACIAAHRPVMVLLDEPSSGIAQREVEALAPVLRRLRDEMGASLLVIEHDIPLISSISDRLVALDQGAVLTEGAPADVLGHPDVIESYLGNNAAARERSGTRG
ncbi:MAG: MFS transporter [Ilumatobacteraceae bacterium]|nr:MFS transporter [Ilumatobacteraceae bacterium]MBP7888359.1 MFS transporter [Ilumatobacteraceae bacterium]MBP8208691.1 MFS transporter [Ilumatobacteraceae bacterium]MBP9053005.1 MFS transporter [Ilumatobacteraceae bacterium]